MTLPIIRTYSWTSRTAALNQCSSPATLEPRPCEKAEIAGLELLDAVAQFRGLFELEIRRPGLHLGLQGRHVGFELSLCAERLPFRRNGHVVALINTRHHLVDALHDRRRCDPVLQVV